LLFPGSIHPFSTKASVGLGAFSVFSCKFREGIQHSGNREHRENMSAIRVETAAGGEFGGREEENFSMVGFRFQKR